MRPGQNKRMRGRNNNNNNSNNGGQRRGPNPLTRSYESNGPDVKVRGTAQHIGEKYLQLARDAQTSGDPVAAESYLQHAEHYFRIIATAQQAQQQAQTGYQRQPGELDADEGDDDDLVMPDRFALPGERFPQPVQAAPAQTQPQGGGTGPQPYPERGGFNGERQNNASERQDRQGGGDNGYRAERNDQRQDREPRQDRDQRQDREPRQDRDQRQDREPRAERTFRQDGEQQRDQRQDREPRQDRDARPFVDRSNGERQTGERNFRNDRQARGPRYPRDGQDYRGDRDQNGAREPRLEASVASGGDQPDMAPSAPAPDVAAELPAFITAPVRPVTPTPDLVEAPANQPVAAAEPPAAVSDPVAAESVVAGVVGEAAEGEAFTVRPRRRRRTRAMIEADAAAAAALAGGETPVSE